MRASRSPPGARRAWLVLLPVLLVGLFVWRVGRGAPTPPPPAVPTAVDPGSDADVVAAPPDTGERRVLAADVTTVSGTVGDAAGQPLVGWTVLLAARRERPSAEASSGSSSRASRPREHDTWGPDRREAVTDATGAFTFEAVDAGANTVLLEAARDVMADVDVVAGQRHRVELGLPGDRCAVVLLLSRRGVAMRSGRVQVLFADGSERFHAAEDGAWRFGAARGTHRVRVLTGLGEPSSAALTLAGPRSPGGRCLAELPLVVPPGVPTLRLQLDVPVPSLEVVASDGGRTPFPRLMFVVEGVAAIGGDKIRHEFVAIDGLRGRVDELPPGEWTVTAHSPCFVAEPLALHVPPGADEHRVVLTGRRAAVVQLDLRRASGRPFVLSTAARRYADRLPALRSEGHETACGDVAQYLVPRPDRAALGFAGVPIGPAHWPIADREVDGALQFTMFDPLSAALEVLPVDVNRLTVSVEPRAFVELIACRSNGMELPTARLRVFRGAEPVAPLGERGRSRWSSFLPPDEYRVEVDESEPGSDAVQRRDHVLFVQRSDVTLRLRR